MAYKRKTYKEKLQNNHTSEGDLPRIEKITLNQAKLWGEGTIVIPAPIEVDEIMRKVPKGKLIAINGIREYLAKRHGATIGCPITTGIFANIAAHAAEEEKTVGKKRITPYWRTVKKGGEINEKYPGGINNQVEKLEEEGFRVIIKGKKAKVAEYEKYLVNLK